MCCARQELFWGLIGRSHSDKRREGHECAADGSAPFGTPDTGGRMSCNGSTLRISGSGCTWSCSAIALQFLLLFVHAVEIVLLMVVGSDGKLKAQHNDGLPFFWRVHVLSSFLFGGQTSWMSNCVAFKAVRRSACRMQQLCSCAFSRQTAPAVSCIAKLKKFSFFDAQVQLDERRKLREFDHQFVENRRSVCSAQGTHP